jgi:signal transduction histidine kinase
VTDTELLALVRDRGQGFDTSVHTGPDRRGIADSIAGRMEQHGGTAQIRSTPGEGTEVELRMPL